jgi:hypothetical protein
LAGIVQLDLAVIFICIHLQLETLVLLLLSLPRTQHLLHQLRLHALPRFFSLLRVCLLEDRGLVFVVVDVYFHHWLKELLLLRAWYPESLLHREVWFAGVSHLAAQLLLVVSKRRSCEVRSNW